MCDNLLPLPYALDGASGGFLNGKLPLVCGGYKGDYPSCSCITLNTTNNTWSNYGNSKECRSYAGAAVLPDFSTLNDSLWMAGGNGMNGKIHLDDQAGS